MNTRLMRSARRERGAVAIIVALVMVLLIGAAALGVDIAKLVYERQRLQNALDAAATAAAQQLPQNPGLALSDATSAAKADFARDNMLAIPLSDIRLELFCVVGYNTVTGSADAVAAKYLCGITNTATFKCKSGICSAPCSAAAGHKCNTILVKGSVEVPFSFAPAVGLAASGTTGDMAAAACRGLCGKAMPNPMDVVVMADRTYSMSSSAVDQMQDGIRGMLAKMTPAQQFVAFGAIHKSITSSGCLTGVASTSSSPYASGSFDSYDRATSNVRFKGTWVPVAFSDSYATVSSSGTSLNTSSSLVKSVNCLQHENNGLGTHLASAMKGAARYLLGKDPNNLGTLNAKGTRTGLGEPKKVIIFETDGRPEELFSTGNAADLELTNSNDVGGGVYEPQYDIKYDKRGREISRTLTGYEWDNDGEIGCQNLVTVADKAKAAGVLIITIGYGNATEFTCAKRDNCSSGLCNEGSKYVDEYLAAAASKDEAGNPSKADKSCADENKDGDYYFCAANGDDLEGIFITAMGAIEGHSRLLALP